MKIRMKEFDETIKRKLGDSMTPPPNPETVEAIYLEHGEHIGDTSTEVDDVVYDEHDLMYEGLYGESTTIMVEANEIGDPDLYYNAEVMLPKDGKHMQAARVIGQSKDKKGKFIGAFNQNPVLNTKVYDVLL